MDETQIINPFGFTLAKKLIDENRKPQEFWHEYLADKEPELENEFYIFFEDGLLVKKGRSKFRTSQYLKGDKFKSFKSFY